MRTNLMRCFALALGVSISSVAQAQYPQSAPQGNAFGSGFLTVTAAGAATQNPYNNQQVKSRWNNFNMPAGAASQPTSTVFRQVSQQSDELLAPKGSARGGIEEIAPGTPQVNPHAKPEAAARQQVVPKSGSYQPAPGNYSAPSYVPQPDPYTGTSSASSMPNQGCGTPVYSGYGANPYAGNYASPYSAAVNSPWDGSCGSTVPMSAFGQQLAAERPTLFPWFGGVNLLFMDVATNSNKALAITGTPGFYSSSVDPDAALGYEVSAGHYLKCGTYGLGFTYFNFNPDTQQVIFSGTAGSVRPAMQGYHDYNLNFGSGPDQVYNHITGASTDSAGASNVRATRDLDIQGLEVNLFSFGLLGYGRSTPGCSNSVGSHWNPFAGMLSNYGFGRAGGPLTRPAANRVQITTSHGFRWFQISDDAELAYNVDGAPGYQAQDIYDRVNVDNNLYGYQFGGLMNYCLSNRMNFNVGGKFGVYANDVEARRRVGTETQAAYRLGAPTDLASTTYSDVVLATLGQVNAGLGYRISDAWTINGGYQVLGVSGVASSFNQMAQDFGTSAHPASVYANDSLLLHGAYVGANFNW